MKKNLKNRMLTAKSDMNINNRRLKIGDVFEAQNQEEYDWILNNFNVVQKDDV